MADEISDLTDGHINKPASSGEQLVWDEAILAMTNKVIYATPQLSIEQGAVKRYTAAYKVVSEFEVESLAVVCVSGTATVTAETERGGTHTPIAGIDGVSVSSTPAEYNASTPPTLAVGDSLVLNVTGASSVVEMAARFKLRRRYT